MALSEYGWCFVDIARAMSRLEASAATPPQTQVEEPASSHQARFTYPKRELPRERTVDEIDRALYRCRKYLQENLEMPIVEIAYRFYFPSDDIPRCNISIETMQSIESRLTRIIVKQLSLLDDLQLNSLERADNNNDLIIPHGATTYHKQWYGIEEMEPDNLGQMIAGYLKLHKDLVLEAVQFINRSEREDKGEIYEYLLYELISKGYYEQAARIIVNIDLMSVKAQASVTLGARLAKKKLIQEAIASLSDEEEVKKIGAFIWIAYELTDCGYLKLAYEATQKLKPCTVQSKIVLEIARHYREAGDLDRAGQLTTQVIVQEDPHLSGHVDLSLSIPIAIELMRLQGRSGEEYLTQTLSKTWKYQSLKKQDQVLDQIVFLLVEGGCAEVIPQALSKIDKAQVDRSLYKTGQYCVRKGIDLAPILDQMKESSYHYQLTLLSILAAQKRGEFAHAERLLTPIIEKQDANLDENLRNAVFGQLGHIPEEKRKAYYTIANLLVQQVEDQKERSLLQSELVTECLATPDLHYFALTVARDIATPEVQVHAYLIITLKQLERDVESGKQVLKMTFEEIFTLQNLDLQRKLCAIVMHRLEERGFKHLARELPQNMIAQIEALREIRRGLRA